MLRVVKGIDDLLDLREWFGRQPVLALDTETSGFDIFDPAFEVRTIQFANADEAWIVPFEGWRAPVTQLLDVYDGDLLMHNSAYDMKALAARGCKIAWHKVKDTFLAMRLAEPHKRAGLKDVATRLVSAGAAKSQKNLHKAMRANGWTWATVPIDFYPYLFYGALDPVLTYRVAETRTCIGGFNSPLYRMEMEVREICCVMETNGMRVDTTSSQLNSRTFKDEVEAIKLEYQETHGVSLTSNAEFARWLLTHNAPLTGVTDGGAPSVDKDSLLDARVGTNDQMVIDAIDAALRVRKLQKLASTYFDNFVEMSRDGLLHPSIETVAAKTGRQSIRAPALQTLPRGDDDPDAMLVRQAVIPRNEGDVLVTCDYDQIELRLIASMSGDPGLIGAFAEADVEGAADFFTTATRTVYNDPEIPKSDPRRTGVKTLFYASSYGAGVKKMAAQAKMPVEDMQEISAKVFKRYPGIKSLMKLCEIEAEANDDWITTPAGRRIWVDPDKRYVALNAKIQATAGDIFKQAIVNLGNAGLAEYMVVPVHDEILFSMPADMVDDARPVIQQVMSELDSFDVPIKAGPSAPGPSWAAVK